MLLRSTSTITLTMMSNPESSASTKVLLGLLSMTRLLQKNDTNGGEDGGGSGGGKSDSTPSTNSASFAPSAAPNNAPTKHSSSSSGGGPIMGFGWFTLSVIVLVLLFLAWICYGQYRKKREQRMLQSRSAQADRVLGDMQMVPNADLDNELI